jgi:hypothetical protein
MTVAEITVRYQRGGRQSGQDRKVGLQTTGAFDCTMQLATSIHDPASQ